jgi:hypothetical protein
LNRGHPFGLLVKLVKTKHTKCPGIAVEKAFFGEQNDGFIGIVKKGAKKLLMIPHWYSPAKYVVTNLL